MSKHCPASDYLRGRCIHAEKVWSWLLIDLDVFALPPDLEERAELEPLFAACHRGVPPRLSNWALGIVARDGMLRTSAIQRVPLDTHGSKLLRPDGRIHHKYVSGKLSGCYFKTSGVRPLVITEGPEDCLSIRQETGHRTWAKLGSLSGLKVADFEDEDEIILGIDGDPQSSIEARRATHRAIERLANERDGIFVATPNGPASLKADWNSMLQEGRTDEIRMAITNPEPAHKWLKSNPLPSLATA